MSDNLKNYDHIIAAANKFRWEVGEQFHDSIIESIYKEAETISNKVVSIDNKNVYYSCKYQELITHINFTILWPANITNFIFVLNESLGYESHFNEFSYNMVMHHSLNWLAQSYNVDNLTLQNNYYFDSDFYTQVA